MSDTDRAAAEVARSPKRTFIGVVVVEVIVVLALWLLSRHFGG